MFTEQQNYKVGVQELDKALSDSVPWKKKL